MSRGVRGAHTSGAPFDKLPRVTDRAAVGASNAATADQEQPTALELAEEGVAIAAKIGTGPPFRADMPWPARYAEMIENIKRAAEIPPPRISQIKLTREQIAAIPHAEPTARFGLPTYTVPCLPPDLIGFPVELVDQVEDSTPYQTQQTKIRAAVGHGHCIVACAASDEVRVTDAVAGLSGIEVRAVPFLDEGDVLVLEKPAVERAVSPVHSERIMTGNQRKLRRLLDERGPELYALTVFGIIGLVGIIGLCLGWWR